MKRFSLLFSLLLALACPAQAKIYLYVDADGRKGATDRRTEVPAGARIVTVIDDGSQTNESKLRKPSGVRAFGPVNFPRIDEATQRKRDDVRRAVLEEELASERRNLEEAKRELALGEKLLPGERPDSPAYQARTRQLRSAVERHERNIAAIRKELEAVR